MHQRTSKVAAARRGVWRLALLILSSMTVACGVRSSVESEDPWYPTYSHYRASQEEVIVFIHGYGGSEETFAVVPYLVASGLEGRQRSIMYFNYDTGALKRGLDSFSVIGSQLRAFLQTNIFSRNPAQRVNIICHSTGCAVIRQYVADNPFDHGIHRVIMVGGANYGAYYAESASRIKALIPWLHGDKQVQQLKFGSFALLYLQQRWHHLYLRTKFATLDPGWFGQYFKSFRNVVTEKVDAEYLHPSPNEPWKRVHRVELPEVAAVVGTNGWSTSGTERFSDGVIRLESGIPDCRFLAAMSTLVWPNLLRSPACKDRLIVFLPCYHTKLFTEEPCRSVIRDLARYFFAEARTPEEIQETEAARKIFLDSYQIVDQDRLRRYLDDVDSAALWVHVRYLGLAREALESIRVTVTSNGNAMKRVAPLPLHLLESDFRDAVRTSTTELERIFYFKYVEALGPTNLDLAIEIGSKKLSIRRVGPPLGTDTGVIRVVPGQTQMIACRGQEESNEIECENLNAP